MYKITSTSQFKKDYKRVQKRHLDLNELQVVIRMLSEGQTLPEKYKDHALIGNKRNSRECHIRPDFLLQYRIDSEILTLILIRTGSHSDIFE